MFLRDKYKSLDVLDVCFKCHIDKTKSKDKPSAGTLTWGCAVPVVQELEAELIKSRSVRAVWAARWNTHLKNTSRDQLKRKLKFS